MVFVFIAMITLMITVIMKMMIMVVVMKKMMMISSLLWCCFLLPFVTLHHEMSRNVPDGHFHVFIFSESKFYAFYHGKKHFQIRELVAELHVFEYGSTTFGAFVKTGFKCRRLLP